MKPVSNLFAPALCALLAAATGWGCTGTGTGSDGGTDAGADGEVRRWGRCPFPYTVPGTTLLEDDMGAEREVHHVHVRCAIEFEDVHAEILIKARPVEIKNQATLFEVDAAYLCRDERVEVLPAGMAEFGSIGRHCWKSFEVAFDGRRYAFSMGEMCVGARPCVPWPDQFDVRRLDDATLLAEAVPAVCAAVGEQGVPAPLVPLVRIPPEGENIPFSMGSEEGDPDEQPVHTFQVWPNYLDLREATNEDFALFLNDHGNDCEGHPCVDPAGTGLRIAEQEGIWVAEKDSEDHPVVQVTWHGANAYCQWRRMLLPFESNWEMAASAMAERRYPWGDEPPDCDRAVYTDCGADGPAPVCTHQAGNSREGLCDLAGNVSEWIGDFYREDQYTVCTADKTCARGPHTGDEHVIRGGSFSLPAHYLRATDRDHAPPDQAAPDRGLRCMASNPSF